jgi:hypothetical protein
MLKQKNFPTVLFHDGATFTDLSLDMLSFGRDSAVVPLLAAAGALYFARFKPFSALYAEVKVPNAVGAFLTLEYWNGTAWTALSNVVDDSDAFSRSGFIQFDTPEDWAETTVNTLSGYFLKITPSVDLTGTMALQGLNVVFSDDQDLRGIYPSVLNYLDSQETSFILRHENSRDRVVETIRKIGRKSTAGSGKYESYDAWDFLHIEEVRLWATYLTMENIFSGLQSKDSDMFMEKAKEYRMLAEQARADSFLTLDANNDGVPAKVEEAANISSRRLVRG